MWVLLTLIAIIVAIGCFMAYRAKQKVTEFKSDFTSSLKSLDDASRALSNPNSVPKEQSDVYINTKDSLPRSLQDKFIAFKFTYPKTFKVQPQSEVNFVKVAEKYVKAKATRPRTSRSVALCSTRQTRKAMHYMTPSSTS